MNNKIRLIITIIICLVLFSFMMISYGAITINDKTIDLEDGNSDATTGGVTKGMGVANPNGAYSGVEYTITITDRGRNAVLHTITRKLYCKDGEINRGTKSGIKGYGILALTDLEPDPDLPENAENFEILPEDVVDFLEKIGEEDALETLKEGQNLRVRVLARSFLCTYQAGYGHVERYWSDVCNDYFENFTNPKLANPTTNAPFRDGRGRIFEENQAWKAEAALYGPTQCAVDKINRKYREECISIYNGWGITEYEISPIDKKELDMPANTKSFVIAHIDNEMFKVYDSSKGINGNAIPTSEDLTVNIKGNAYGIVDGIKKEGKDVSNVKINGKVIIQYYDYDKDNNVLTLKEMTKTHENTTSGTITWLNAEDVEIDSSGKADTSAKIKITNELLLGNEHELEKNVTIKVTKDDNRGNYELLVPEDPENIRTIKVSEYEEAMLKELQKYAVNGNWASDKILEITGNMREDAKQTINEITPFFSVNTDKVEYKVGSTIVNVEKNGELIGPIYDVDSTSTIDKLELNKSVDSNVYESNGTLVLQRNGVEERTTVPSPHFNKVNNVRVHTPINQAFLVNGMPLVSGIAIAKPNSGNAKIEITFNADKFSKYYTDIAGLDITKYIREAKVEILNGTTLVSTGTVTGSQIKTNPKILTYEIPSTCATDTNFNIKTTVTAINAPSSILAENKANTKYNEPDNVYQLTQESTVEFVVPNLYKFSLVQDGLSEEEREPFAEAQIDNASFDVKKLGSVENHIPTSKSLEVDGETDLLAKLDGIEKWNVNFGEEYRQIVTLKGKYITGYFIAYRDAAGNEGIEIFDTYEEVQQVELKEVGEGENKRTYGDAWPITETAETVSINKVIKGNELSPIMYIAAKNAELDNSVEVVIQNTALGDSVLGSRKQTIMNNSDIVFANNPASFKSGDDKNRVDFNNTVNIGTFDSYESLIDALESYELKVNVSEFISVETDEIEIKKGSSPAKRTYTSNEPILTEDFSEYDLTGKISFGGPDLDQEKIPPIANGRYSSEGKLYCGLDLGGYTIKGRDGAIKINPVNIFTPIYNKVEITATAENRLSNEEVSAYNAAGYDIQKITKLGTGNSVKTTISLHGSRTYDNNMFKPGAPIGNLNQYVKELKIECDICDETVTYTRPAGTILNSTYEHECGILPIDKEDGKHYSIKVTVVAENEKPDSTPVHETANQTINEYVLKQSAGVYVVGDIYDFQVRTTDDPGWSQISETQKLNGATVKQELPLGEHAENPNSLYKYGIKLGYRVYFDLKTLGKSNTNIKLEPKYYYIEKNGTVHDVSKEGIKLYYRTAKGPVEFTSGTLQLKTSLIGSKANVNNNDYLTEQSKSITSDYYKGVDYKFAKSIGNLTEIILGKVNSMTTKYKNPDGTEVYADSTKADASKRWYGEIYIPASTIVAKNEATYSQIVSGTNIYKEGYLLVTFERVTSLKSDGSTYLDYNVDRENLEAITNEQLEEEASKSKVLEEKEGDNKVDLPTFTTAKVIENYDKWNIPVIIYDISQRANNDYETSGTH